MKRRTEYEKFKKFCINKDIVQDLKEEDFDLKFSTHFSYPFPGHKFKLVRLPGHSRLVALDFGISDIIEYLNSKGYYTRFCCEGHEIKRWPKKCKSGYIYFEELPEDKCAKIRQVFGSLENVVIRDEGDIFRFYSDQHKKMLEDLYKLIKEII